MTSAKATQLRRRIERRALGQVPSVLQVSELSVRRGDVLILDRISWAVHRGEHWAMLGANGSGKTSLLSALTGYLMPSEGEIEVLGERYGCTDWRELRKRIGLVSSSVRQMMADTEPALDTVVSGKYAMIDYWGKVSPEDRRKAQRILQKVECRYLENRCWGVLSQGERQRVLIGRALMADPALLILDEPCAGLDPVARDHFLAFIGRLGAGRRAPTMILTTHHVDELVPLFSHVLLLRAGRIVGSGPKDDVLTSRGLSATFGAALRLMKSGVRYRLELGS